MTESMIYWINRLDEIRSFCLGLNIISSIFAIIGIMAALVTTCFKAVFESEGSDADARAANSIRKFACKIFIPAFCIATLCSLARTFTPTTKEMIAIKVFPQIASVDNVEKINDISKDMLDITADWLKDMKKKHVNGQDK